MAAARSLGQAFHQNRIKLVYGGGTVGLMGEVARTLVSLSGPDAVHGIIPEALIKYEASLPSDVKTTQGDIPESRFFGKTTVVKSMHDRKQKMAQEVKEGGPGSGFVALSGGYGTVEELMEMTTWNQVGIHRDAVVLYNVEGYWDLLIQWIQQASKAGFISTPNTMIVQSANDADTVIKALKEYEISAGQLQLDWEST